MPLLLAACKPDSEHPLPVKDPVLTLASDDVIELKTEGGVCEIRYVLENPIEGSEIAVECDANWIDYKVFADDSMVSLSVEANEGDAREAKVVIRYDVASVEVAVKQAAKPFEGYELSFMTGTYYAPGSEFNPTENHDYYVVLSSVNDFSTYAPNGVYVELDLWAATVDAENPTIPEGEYVIDTQDSGAPGVIGASYTRLLEMDANQSPVVWVLPIEGKVVVSNNKIEGYLQDEYSGKVWFRYTGSLSVNAE